MAKSRVMSVKRRLIKRNILLKLEVVQLFIMIYLDVDKQKKLKKNLKLLDFNKLKLLRTKYVNIQNNFFSLTIQKIPIQFAEVRNNLYNVLDLKKKVRKQFKLFIGLFVYDYCFIWIYLWFELRVNKIGIKNYLKKKKCMVIRKKNILYSTLYLDKF